ncbi:MAG: CotH kinase family protein [Muribaculaceae bacterium]|nr:CotH kinase family protein [Muribaculaceae bacterium]
MKRLFFITMLVLVLAGCKHEADNFPPDDTGVVLTSTNLPIVWVEVRGKTIDRYERIDARMKIIDNGQGQLNYADTVAHPGQRIDYQGHIALRYRGNSTYNDSPKKPYSFRTLDGPMKYASKQKVKILGMGRDDNWALLAPYADKSMMRDLLTYELMRPWMEFTPQGRYCELFVDGTYYGVYILSEVVSKGRHRLDLLKPRDEGEELTGDYLLEVDCNDEVTYTSRYHPVSSTGVPYKDRHILIQYKYPNHDKLDDRQLAYIHSCINRMEAALASPGYSDPETGYRRYLDVESFIDYQIATELGHNVDGYRLSGKFYKRRDDVDGRFKMAIWDTNLAYGNCDRCDGWRTDTWVYQSNDVLYRAGEVYLVPFWWYRLNSDEAYTAQLKARWAQMRAANLSEDRVMASVDSLASVLTSHGAEARNSQAWPRWGQYVWPNYYVAKDFNDEVAYIKRWLHDRIAWMDQALDFGPAEE